MKAPHLCQTVLRREAGGKYVDDRGKQRPVLIPDETLQNHPSEIGASRGNRTLNLTIIDRLLYR